MAIRIKCRLLAGAPSVFSWHANYLIVINPIISFGEILGAGSISNLQNTITLWYHIQAGCMSCATNSGAAMVVALESSSIGTRHFLLISFDIQPVYAVRVTSQSVLGRMLKRSWKQRQRVKVNGSYDNVTNISCCPGTSTGMSTSNKYELKPVQGNYFIPSMGYRSILMRFFGGEQKYTDLEQMDLIGHKKVMVTMVLWCPSWELTKSAATSLFY